MPAQTVESALPLGDLLAAILSMPYQEEVTLDCNECGVGHQGIAGATGFTKNGNRRRKVRMSSGVAVMFHTFEDETFIIGSAMHSTYGRHDEGSIGRVRVIAERRCQKQQAKKAIVAPEQSIEALLDQQAEVPDYA